MSQPTQCYVHIGVIIDAISYCHVGDWAGISGPGGVVFSELRFDFNSFFFLSGLIQAILVSM